MNISQRHTHTIYNVAACLARLADFEWHKVCECVRRFSPAIGPLVSFRSLCEGGWTGPLPSNLPDITGPNVVPTPQAELDARLNSLEENNRQSTTATPEPPNHPEQPHVVMQTYPTFTNQDKYLDQVQDTQVDRDPQPILTRWTPASTSVSTSTVPDVTSATLSTDTLEPPKAPSVDPHTGSVRSLSAFPEPPTHFPIPLTLSQQSTNSRSIQSTPRLEFPSRSPLAESPVSSHDDFSAEKPGAASRIGHTDSAATRSTEELSPVYKRPTTLEVTDVMKDCERQQYPSSHWPQTPSPQGFTSWNSRQISPPSHRSTNSVEIKPLKLYRDKEPPASRELNNISDSPTQPKTLMTENYKYMRMVERTDTGTSAGGSIVAAMRTRYDNNASFDSFAYLLVLPLFSLAQFHPLHEICHVFLSVLTIWQHAIR